MTKTVEFRPTIKAVKMNKGGKQEVVLSIENGSLGGKFESLSQLIGEAVNVVIQPSVISYRIPYDRETGEVFYGRVPAGSVVVSGSLPSKCGKYSLYCAVIVKKVDAKTLGKVGINELLRSIEE